MKNQDVKIIKISELPKGSFIHTLATGNIAAKGFYNCIYQGVKTQIIN